MSLSYIRRFIKLYMEKKVGKEVTQNIRKQDINQCLFIVIQDPHGIMLKTITGLRKSTTHDSDAGLKSH